VSERRLDEPSRARTLVLLPQHTTELDQRVRASIVERPEDALAIVDRQRDHSGLKRERLLEERARRLVDERLELSSASVRSRVGRLATSSHEIGFATTGATFSSTSCPDSGVRLRSSRASKRGSRRCRTRGA
jgi:hypothetical protein